MAVEDHPKWNAWSEAFDVLVEAEKDLAKHRISSDGMHRRARARYNAALDRYNKIADELEAGGHRSPASGEA